MLAAQDARGLTPEMKSCAERHESTDRFILDRATILMPLGLIEQFCQYETNYTGCVTIPIGRDHKIELYATNGVFCFNQLLCELHDLAYAEQNHGKILAPAGYDAMNILWRQVCRHYNQGMSNYQVMDIYRTLPMIKTCFCEHVRNCMIDQNCQACKNR